MVNTSSWWTRDSHDQIPISGTFTAYYGRLQFCYLEWRHYGTYFMYFLRIIYWSNLSITESSRSPTFRWSWTIYLCGMVSWTTKHSVFLWWKWYSWSLDSLYWSSLPIIRSLDFTWKFKSVLFFFFDELYKSKLSTFPNFITYILLMTITWLWMLPCFYSCVSAQNATTTHIFR